MALAGTLGTMGVLTRLDIRLLEAKPYVKLTYQPVWTFQEAKDTIESAISPDAGNDFVDGIMYSKTKGAIVSGKMVSETGGGQITQYARPSDEWCFIHTEEMIEGHNTKSYMEKRSTSPVVDFVPLTDYLFRYDRGAFWMGKLGCQHFCLPFTKTTRTLLDSLFHTREMYTVSILRFMMGNNDLCSIGTTCEQNARVPHCRRSGGPFPEHGPILGLPRG